MDIKSLKYFLTVVQEGTITRAAKKLCIAQPPLSRQIRLLEEELGVTLFLRGKKKIQLTEEGRFLKQQAEEIIELMEKTREQMGRLGGGVHGLVSVAAVESFGIGICQRWWRPFTESIPRYISRSGAATAMKSVTSWRGGWQMWESCGRRSTWNSVSRSFFEVSLGWLP